MRDGIRSVVSRPVSQPIFEQLLKLCHAAMNYGGAQSVEYSGETGALEFVRDTVGKSEPFVLFDVGANDGEYLQVALNTIGPRTVAYSFEPQSHCYEMLSARFKGDRRVTLKKLALGREAGSAQLFFDHAGDTTASFQRGSVYLHAPADAVKSEDVPLGSLDQFCREQGITKIDFLKIDTEGFEFDVLQGASSMLEEGAIRAIQFEFGDTYLRTPYHFGDFWDFLSPRFRIFRVLRRGLTEVRSYSPDLEIYKIVNYLALRKA
jgi:FkbM family methyltransferase